MDDKLMEEEDLKGLEEEIDNAVDRLFVEKKRGSAESHLTESPRVEPPLKPSVLEPSSSEPPAFDPSSFEPPMGPPVLESPMNRQPLEPSIKFPDLEPSALEPPPLEPPSLEPSSLEPSSLEPSSLESSMESPMFEPPVKPQPLKPSMKPPVLEPSGRSSLLEPSYEFEKSLDAESSLIPPSVPPPPPSSVPFSKSVETMEAQLLSLEWDITEEKLRKTKEEILALKELSKQKPNLTWILSSMEKVLNHMIKNEEDIRPAWIKFLLDSKETIKLLMRKETEGEMKIYKQLAYLGIEARFSCLEGMADTKIAQSSLKEEFGKPDASGLGEKKIEEMSKSVHLFMKRVEEGFGMIQQQILRLEETTRRSPAPAFNVTIFKISEKLFGVETEKIFKLFRVPKTFEEKYSDRERIRLRDFEVKMVDLKKVLAIQVEGERPKDQIRILTVKEDGEYKGFMVDQVLRKLTAPSEKRGKAGRYFSGIIHSTYQEQPVEIPVLDLKKF